MDAQTFDELVLLKRGGVIIYSGALGKDSATMVSYFESIPGVPKIAKDFNPVRPCHDNKQGFRRTVSYLSLHGFVLRICFQSQLRRCCSS